MDISFVENNLKEILVVPNAQSAYYPERENGIGLPYLSYKVLVPQNCSYKDVNFSAEKDLLFDDCIIAPAPKSEATSVWTLNCNTSNLPKGIISVSLFVDGKLEDTISFNNK